MRALFFGTPEIAVPALNALHEIATITAVVCQPDRPSGRGLKLKAPPVKQRAQELGLDVHQPKKVRTAGFAEWMEGQRADVALVIAYGRILPVRVLEAPRRGCINLHASLLPYYRGAAPINWAIVKGETKTGVSLMQMDKGCDTGPVFSVREIPIGPNESAGELYTRLGALAADMTREILPSVVDGKLKSSAQDHSRATHAPMLSRSDGAVDWTADAQTIHNRIRGLTPWPGAHTMLDGKRVKLLRTALASHAIEAPPGTIRRLEKNTIAIACGGDGPALLLLRAQLPGRKALDARDLLAGRALGDGQRFASNPAVAGPD